jgi:hypothetical protein
VRQDAQQPAHVVDRLAPGGLDGGQRLAHLRLLALEHPRRALGLHDHDADVVRDDVVQLAGDAGALVGHRLAGAQLALALGALRALAEERGEQLAAMQRDACHEGRHEEDVGRHDVAGALQPAREPRGIAQHPEPHQDDEGDERGAAATVQAQREGRHQEEQEAREGPCSQP